MRAPGDHKRKRSVPPLRRKALCALLFLYHHILGREVGNLGEVIRVRKPTRLPVVMTRDEVKTVLGNLSGDRWLIASLMSSP